MTVLREEIQTRLDGALRRLAAGEDLPPAERLRLEGMCEAAVLIGAVDERDIDVLFDATMRDVHGVSVRDALGEDWRSLHPFPELPMYMQRAPVSPTTGR